MACPWELLTEKPSGPEGRFELVKSLLQSLPPRFPPYIPLMFARPLARATATRSVPLAAAPANARNMATLREIELRLKSVKNIEKITKVSFTGFAEKQEACADDDSLVVHENDCFHQAGKGTESYASWKGVRYCQLGWVDLHA
jgi:hypothetical protein